VQAGNYRWVLRTETSAGTQVKSKGLTVLRAVDAGLSREPVLAPNPAHADATSTFGVFLDYPAGELLEARATAYSVAGERVALAGEGGSPGRIRMEWVGKAGGVYLVVLEGRLRNGASYRRVFKAAVLQ
jgi:hypothetical protein